MVTTATNGLSVAGAAQATAVKQFFDGFSIEIMPRTAVKIPDFRNILPSGTRVYIAHIEGTALEDMVRTAKRLMDDGFPVMPHFPARIYRNKAEFREAVARYRGEAGVSQALVLAGGISRPRGDLHSSMQLLETGFLDAMGFERIHVAGHPEGNRDIDPDGTTENVDQALKQKQKLLDRTDASIAVTTQFTFDANPVIAWVERIAVAGISLPVHVGVAGPARLQTLLKFAVACGVGPSLKIVQKRSRDLSKMLQPFEPTEVVSNIAQYKNRNPNSNIECVHLFPLGGIEASAKWAARYGGRLP